MTKRKVVSMILAVALILVTMTGCMGEEATIKINKDGSGKMTIFAGYSEKALDVITSSMGEESTIDKDELQIMERNGVKYYGEYQEFEFGSIEELNSNLTSTSTSSASTPSTSNIFKIERNEQGVVTLTLHLEESDFESLNYDTSTYEPAGSGEPSKEMMEELMKDVLMQFIFDFPSTVYQVSGPSSIPGVTLNGNKLTLDFISMKDSVTAKGLELKWSTSNTANKVENTRFSDVATDAWYYKAVEAVAKGGIVGGYGDSTFKPNTEMSLAAFCKVASSLMELDTDVTSSTYWAYGYIKTCLANGYILDHGKITPENYDKPITREEAIYGLEKAYEDSYSKFKEKPVDKHSYTSKDIPDISEVSEKYRDGVIKAYNYGLTSGSDDARTFNPKQILTRAQICQLLYNINWTAPRK